MQLINKVSLYSSSFDSRCCSLPRPPPPFPIPSGSFPPINLRPPNPNHTILSPLPSDLALSSRPSPLFVLLLLLLRRRRRRRRRWWSATRGRGQMPNGEGPSDLDDFVLRSGIRSGLKREFAFALKAQASLPVALGRTRSGKALASPAVAASPRVSKRPRKSSGGDLTPCPAVFLDLPRPGSNAVTAQVPVGIDCKAETASTGSRLQIYNDDELKGEVATDAPAPMEVDYKSTTADAVLALEVVKPIKVFVRSFSTARHEGLVTSPPRPINLTGIPVEAANACSDDGVGLPHKGNATDNSDMVVDSIDSINVVRLLSGSEMPPSMLREVAVVSLPPQATVDDTSTLDESTVASPPQQAAVHVTPSVLGSSQSVGSRDGPKYFRRFASPLKVSTTVGTMDLTSNSATKENICVIHKDNDSQRLERPPRRFTRSLLKVETEDSGSVDGSNANSKSSGSEETKGTINVVNATLSSTPKKKMELKMSKKIALTKLPANSRELIATGLLEGLHVQYVNVNGKLSQLQGVIKDNGILCSCSSCNGSVVVSTYVFEQHAGSTKKHPADFIYLDNGKNLRDVVKACTSAPLDMLEAVIQGAVGLQPPDKSSVCQKCQASFYASGAGNSAFLCDKCLELKQTPKTPGPINVNASATRLSRANTISGSSNGSSKNISSNKKASIGKLTRKDLGLHKLVFMNDILPEGTEVGYYVRGKRLREGYIKDSGIYCLCCNTVVSPSQFEAHAGQASRRKPYNNIYTSNGVSLHELSVSLSKDRKLSTNENDDLCSICADGGNLLLCDLCPRAFHKECVGLPSIPKEDWYCQYCTNLHQRERSVACNDNAIAAGRVAGVDPIEQIFKRCIRMVTTEFDIGSCTLCRLHDFSKSGFDDRTVMICDQCEKEYHVGCLRDNKMADLKELPEEEWFCCDDCKRIRISLQELLQHEPESLLPINAKLIKKCESNGMNENANVDITWRILSGKTAEEEIKLLLSRAVAIFHESFDPIVDAATGRDLIPSMVYGRTVRDQDYGGMYCAILTVGATIVSAGILRVLGSEVAELPLVATSREHQGKGYFQSLFACIERLLASLKIKHFVLPAADEAESIWTKKFGFSKVTSEQLEEILNGVRTTVFQGTSMLHKPVPVAIASCQAEPTADVAIASCQAEPTADVAIASCQAEQPADVESIVSCQREPIVHEELIIACQGETVAHVESIISCQGVGHEKAIISCQGETVAHEELKFSFEGEPTADVDDMVSFQQERAGEERPTVPCEGVH